MVTDFKVVVNLLIVVLFLTMVIFSPKLIDFGYFMYIFCFLKKIDWF